MFEQENFAYPTEKDFSYPTKKIFTYPIKKFHLTKKFLDLKNTDAAEIYIF